MDKRILFGGNSCICTAGFYDDGLNGSCKVCNYTCATCGNNQPDICLSCNALTNRQFVSG